MTWDLIIENIAGIRSGNATLEPGVNAVMATNWQGKSSFIAAIETALGTDYTLTEGEDGGHVRLETPDGVVDVELVRENGSVVTRGDPLLTDEYDVIRADLFACLDATNPVRRAVRDGTSLDDPLTRPLEFENIDERIRDIESQRDRVDAELSGAREAARRLPTVEERIEGLQSEITALRDQLDRVSDGDDSADQDELSQKRAERDRVQSRVDRLEDTIQRIESTLAEKRSDLESLSLPGTDSVAADLEEARERLDSAQRDVDVLQSLYSANQAVLQEDRLDLVTDVERDLAGDEVTCWICGSATTRGDLQERIEAIGDRIGERRGSVERYRDRVEDLEAKRERRAQAKRRRTTLEDEIRDLEDELSDRRESLASARGRLETLSDRIDDLEEDVEETVAKVADIESEVKYREAELEDARDELETLETRAQQRDDLESQRADLTAELETLRTRKERVKRRTREAFDAAMAGLLERFDAGFESARLTHEFDLVVARDGREASLDALSEGELELIGFVAALAGHEAFDVGEHVPVLLVDDVGSLAEENLRRLIDYISDRAEYVVFTTHPGTLDFDGTVVDPTSWSVVSDRIDA